MCRNLKGAEMNLLSRNIFMAVAAIVLSLAGMGRAYAAEEDIDVQEIIFGHIGDSYEWHITDIGKREISIPLPVIVHSSTGWHCFLSSRLEDGAVYEGLYISSSDRYDGKVVELDAAGNEVRPLDISHYQECAVSDDQQRTSRGAHPLLCKMVPEA